MARPDTAEIAAAGTEVRSQVISVLLIEANRTAAVMVNRILTESGCSVTSAETASEVQQALDAAQFDLVLLGTLANDEAVFVQELLRSRSAAPLTVLWNTPSQALGGRVEGCMPTEAMAAFLSGIDSLRSRP